MKLGCTELKFLQSFGAGFCNERRILATDIHRWNTDFDRMNRIKRMIERETPREGTRPTTEPRPLGRRSEGG